MKTVNLQSGKMFLLTLVVSFSAVAQNGVRTSAKAGLIPPSESPLCAYTDPETSELVITHCAGDQDGQLCAYKDENGRIIVRHCDIPSDPTE